MKVLLTGACGFIGRNLITELETRGHELRLVDMTRPEDATMFQGAASRAHVPLETRWPFVQTEITDEAAMVRACAGMDAVVHLAGEPRGLPEIAVHTFRSNALGTFVAIDAGAAQRRPALPVRLQHQRLRHLLLAPERQAGALWEPAAG